MDEEIIGEIGAGLVVLLGVHVQDGESDVQYITDKVRNLRIFEDADGRMNRSVTETDGSVLLVSQFTLYGDARKGRRPGFTEAASPEHGEALYRRVAEALTATGLRVETGRFGAHMVVSLDNDGPVTLLLESGRQF